MFYRDALKSISFSWESALSLAMASQLAYVRSETGIVQLATETWGFVGCIPFSANSTQGFVAWDEDCVLVSYRGTESIGDWLLNASVAPTQRPYGRVHGGFSKGFETGRTLVETALGQAGVAGKRLWLTGHSLGGALAVINAAEWLNRYPVTGVYTFGQPKAVGAEAAQFLRESYDGCLHRLVNDDDIVPGVPPGYRHVGRLYWFDDQGGLKAAGSETESMEATELPTELSESQFKDLQARLQELKTATEMTLPQYQSDIGSEQDSPDLESDRQAVFDASVEGILPSVLDHGIDRYINQIRVQLRSQYTERPAEVDQAIARVIGEVRDDANIGLEFDPKNAVSVSKFSQRGTVPVLLRVSGPDWVPPDLVTIHSRLGNFVTAVAPIDALDGLRDDPGVFSIDASREGGVLELDVSKSFVKAVDVHRPPITEMGDKAIVGIIDSGIDVLHEAFQDSTGNTRILYVWDQRGTTGNAPNVIDANAFSQPYGSLYVQSDIQQMITQGLATKALRDPNGHGTHVASIAAGRAVGAFAGGIAPEAQLIVVIPNMNSKPGDPHSIGYSNSHVDALRFIQSAAAKKGLPVAINVSLGMNAGAHDGSSSLEASFDSTTDMGRLPGVVVVKSAGNERGYKGHSSVAVPQSGYADITWDSAPQERDQDYIEVWFHAFDDIDFVLVDPAGSATPPATVASNKVEVTLNGNFCRLTLSRNHKDNGDNLLVITIEPDGSPIQQGTWTLRMLGKTVLGLGAGVVHAWVERHSSRAITFNTGDTDEMTLSIPGTAKHVITVAACGSALPLQLTSSSSWGPTRDGRSKPDLAAPGVDIVAALANTANHQDTVAQTGTSMAAPHVTGTVALVLSALYKSGKPMANAVQVRRELIATSQNFTGVHNKGVGYGALDTLAFFKRF